MTDPQRALIKFHLTDDEADDLEGADHLLLHMAAERLIANRALGVDERGREP